MKKILACVMLGLCAAGGAAVAAPVQGSAEVQATALMQMERDARCGQVIVTAYVGGTPLKMMLDTGATHTVLHEESAARLQNVQWIDTSKMKFRGNSAQNIKMLVAPLLAGPGESPQHPMMVLNLAAVRSMMAVKIDGIIGMDFLGSMPFTFDFKTNSFYWGLPTGGKVAPIPVEAEPSGRVHVVAQCGGKQLKLLLDTGSTITRVRQEDWAPGVAGEINAHIGDVDTATQQQMVEGKPGDMELAPGVVLRGVKPLLCGPEELTMLGLDALKDAVLIHVPVETVPGGVFLMLSDK